MRLLVIIAFVIMGGTLHAQETEDKKGLLRQARIEVKSDLQKHLDKLSFSGSLSNKKYDFLNLLKLILMTIVHNFLHHL